MLDALREMVDTDGGTYDKAGVDAVGAQVRRFLRSARHPGGDRAARAVRRLPEGARRGRRRRGRGGGGSNARRSSC